MKKSMRMLVPVVALVGTLATSSLATAAQAGRCAELPSDAELKAALQAVVALGAAVFGGNGHPAWMTLVDGSGVVCAVVTELDNPDVTTNQSGIGHRVLSAYKANTSTAYSHDRIALSSGNFYALTLPGGQLWATTLPGLDIEARDGSGRRSASRWGTPSDPMVGQRIGGFSQLAGGLPLFNSEKHKVGAIGVSGNPFCTAHAVAWRVRELLADRNGNVGAFSVANVPGGPACGGTNDALILDVIPDPTGVGGPGTSASGFGYPLCDAFPPAVRTFANGIQDATCFPPPP